MISAPIGSELQRNAAKGRLLRPEAPINQKAGTRRVLVIDDDADVAQTLTAMLRVLGHEARACVSTEECLCCVDDFRPEVMLLDLCMPGCDGFEICREIRRRRLYRHVPVIACSAFHPCLYTEETLNSGFSAVLAKPVSLAQLAAAMNEVAGAGSGTIAAEPRGSA